MIDAINFEAYLNTAPPTIIVKPDLPRFTIIAANQAYLDAVNTRLEDINGMALFEAFPENPNDSVTNNVESLRNNLTQAVLTKKQQVLPSQKYDIPVRGTDKFDVRYWMATNSPILNQEGEVEYVAHVVIDITSAVETVQKERFAFEVAEAKRTATQQMEERLRLAIGSANLGTWHIDVYTRKLISSQRSKEFFGYYPEEEMELEDVMRQVREDYREKVFKAIEGTLSRGEHFDIEYPVIGFHDNKLRWVRATGKLYEAEEARPANFSGTLMDITERKLDEIRKNDFIAMVSHELKTPLTSAKAYIQMLTLKAQRAEDQLTAVSLQKVNLQIDKMHTLIKGFLDVARLEEGKILINPQEFVLSDMLKEAVDELKVLDQTHVFDLNICGEVKVTADKDKIIQVVNNFLSNAVKYSPRETTITVACSIEDNKVIVSVKDRGFGIQVQDKPRLFDRFYRVENKQTKNIAGFGIGLYLCAEIINRHNGQIWVESEPEKGSVFYFSLPL